jgi:hypothetical protein
LDARMSQPARILVLVAAVTACGGVATNGEPEPTVWSAARVREQWPEYNAVDAPLCLTVWVISGDGCAVSDDGTTPLQCASAPDPWVLSVVPDRFGTCIIGIDDCALRSCSPSPEPSR